RNSGVMGIARGSGLAILQCGQERTPMQSNGLWIFSSCGRGFMKPSRMLVCMQFTYRTTSPDGGFRWLIETGQATARIYPPWLSMGQHSGTSLSQSTFKWGWLDTETLTDSHWRPTLQVVRRSPITAIPTATSGSPKAIKEQALKS